MENIESSRIIYFDHAREEQVEIICNTFNYFLDAFNRIAMDGDAEIKEVIIAYQGRHGSTFEYNKIFN